MRLAQTSLKSHAESHRSVVLESISNPPASPTIIHLPKNPHLKVFTVTAISETAKNGYTMGIRQLKKCILQIRNLKDRAYKTVDLKEIIQQWRDTGKPAVVVVDCCSLSSLFCNDFDFIFGGELKEIAPRVKKFIEIFRAISVELVFFSAALLLEKELWKARKKESKGAVLMYWNNLRRQSVSDIDLYPSIYTEAVKQAILDAGCKIIPHPESRSKGMAQYVVENDCLGVFSNDTDFFAFDGIRHVFSTLELDVDSLTTLDFQRNAVIDAFDLERGAEPKFAILMGNNSIEYNDSRRYHNRLLRGNRDLLYKARTLAEKANEIHQKAGNDAEMAAHLLTKEIYGQREAFQQEKWILRSLRSYDVEFKADVTCTRESSRWGDTLNYMYKDYLEKGIGGPILNVIVKQIFIRSVCLEGDSPPFCTASYLAELRRRFYSIILYEKNEPQQQEFVEELSVSGSRDLNTTYLVGTININVDHPGLYKLREGGKELDETRWKLLAWALSTPNFVITSEHLSPYRREDSLDNNALVGLILLYLHIVFVKPTDEDNSFKMTQPYFTALAVMAACVPAMDAVELGNRCVEHTSQHAAFLATLYKQCYQLIRRVLSVCGIKIDCKLYDAYSGLFFHDLMKQTNPMDFLRKKSAPSQARKNYSVLESALEYSVSQDEEFPTKNLLISLS